MVAGPYPEDAPRMNPVRFTPMQVEGLRSAMNPGLTVVVGPPGTGKTDTAVQIVSNIHHTFPQQRTLIITHSNQALNDVFEKLLVRDIDERYMLRLGHGEELLETEKDFSRLGRVNHMLKRRLELLVRVEMLGKALEVPADVGYTCETAGYFYLSAVLARWEEFEQSARKRQSEGASVVALLFPFTEFFVDAPQPLFRGESFEADMEVALGCFRHLQVSGYAPSGRGGRRRMWCDLARICCEVEDWCWRRGLVSPHRPPAAQRPSSPCSHAQHLYRSPPAHTLASHPHTQTA
ncbi:MAG: hypothetical protein SGPRY_004594 [Prymnesium sp.]